MSVTQCPHCGTANRAGSNFCNSCGTDLRPQEARPPEEDGRARADSPEAEQPPQPAADDAVPAIPERYKLEESAGQPLTPETRSQREDAPPPTAEASTGVESERDAETDAERKVEGEAGTEVGDEPDTEILAGQPWLRLDFADDEPPEPLPDEPSTGSRLVTGIQGLLDPVRVAAAGSEQELEQAEVAARRNLSPQSALDLPQAQLRLVRQIMSSEPMLSESSPSSALRIDRTPRIGWINALLLVGLLLPLFLLIPGSRGAGMAWSGVAEAYATIESLPRDALVLVYWAYDPATAGELDLPTLPVIYHLLDRHTRLVVVSTLPGGPATARRMIERVRTERQRSGSLAIAAETIWPVGITYLSGGASVLPLVGQAPALALAGRGQTLDPILAEALDAPPALAVVLAAQTEDVQHWLEQVAPLDQTPVVAVVSAGADPLLRPYLDSGQLSGLVSGFDGAYTYRSLFDQQGITPDVPEMNFRLKMQDWGQLIFLIVILFGNLVALFGRPANSRADQQMK